MVIEILEDSGGRRIFSNKRGSSRFGCWEFFKSLESSIERWDLLGAEMET